MNDRPKPRRFTTYLAACALALAAITWPGARALAKKVVFPTYRIASASLPSGLSPLTLRARDGTFVHAIHIAAPRGARDARTIVYFHNNRDTIADNVWLARELNARGFGVLLVEYRGYGLSQGAEPSEEGLYLDAEAGLDLLSRQGIGPGRVILWGVSLGTGVAAEMARRGRGTALVLVTPYTSIPDVAADAIPILPARILMPDTFDTLAKSREIKVPTLVIHGDADEVIPFWMGERLARTIPGARLVRVSGGHHGDLFLREPDRLLREVVALDRRG